MTGKTMHRLKHSCWRTLFLVWLVGGTPLSAQELPRGFVAETLATNLNAATAMVPLRDGRILLADQTGVVRVWRDGRVFDTPMLTLHVTDYWERGLVGLTVAPDFPATPHLFALYVTDRPFVHHVLSRFTVSGDVADPASERVLIEGDDQAKMGGFQPAGHQGGPLRFGADGRLYVGLGEQTAGEPAQKLDTLIGKILRLNPDGSIPDDNPFVRQAAGKYRSVFAVGVRNPFGIAVEPGSGRMFFTDVGGSAWEEINELRPGGNFGWPAAEGMSTNPAFRAPVWTYPPSVGRSICGGAFYPRTLPAGDAAGLFPGKWRGRFLFLDYISQWLKALDPDQPTNVVTLARGFNGPIAVEVEAGGSLLVLNRGTVWRDPKKFVSHAGSLVRIRYVGADALPTRPVSTAKLALDLPADASRLPRTLSLATVDGWSGAGARALRVNQGPWHPHVSEAARLALPAGAKLRFDTNGAARMPAGAVLIRDFFRESAPGGSATLTRIETRLVALDEPRAWGASYRWTSADEAVLQEEGDVADVGPVADAKGRPTPLNWWFPALDDGLAWPTPNVGFSFPLSLAQLAVVEDGAESKWSQLAEWRQAGWIDDNVTEPAAPFRTVALNDREAPVEQRVRSYLDANCAVCHQPGGASRGLFDARFATPLADAGLVPGELAAGDLGIAGARLVEPGDPEKSILYQRLRRGDFVRMPPVQYHDEPSPLLPVLADWIRSLKAQ
jgi:glucose/arabinose dehydrogenase/mono/diheme cytochrome c family protein